MLQFSNQQSNTIYHFYFLSFILLPFAVFENSHLGHRGESKISSKGLNRFIKTMKKNPNYLQKNLIKTGNLCPTATTIRTSLNKEVHGQTQHLTETHRKDWQFYDVTIQNRNCSATWFLAQELRLVSWKIQSP